MLSQGACAPPSLKGSTAILAYGFGSRRAAERSDIGVVLRALASIEHAVVAHEPYDAMANAHPSERARHKTSGRGPIAPGDQERKLSFVVDAGKYIIVDRTLAARIKTQEVRQGI